MVKAREIQKIVVATSIDVKNLPLVEWVEKLGFACEQGSENDVLERYLHTAQKHQADAVVRITGDCPLIDPVLVDNAIRGFKQSNSEYYSNTQPPTFPDGLDIEVFTRHALEKAALETQKSFDREHVTPYLRESGKFRISAINHNEDLSSLRWTVDEQADFEVIQNVFNYFHPDIHFSWLQVLELQRKQPELFAANRQIRRNEGATMGTGQKLWKHAKELIPGGNMLLSKRAEMFLPEYWPAYFSKAKGCYVWDLDKNQ